MNAVVRTIALLLLLLSQPLFGQQDSMSSQGPRENVAAVQSLLNEAYTHLRVRYVYGGKSPSGFDCSGYVSYCFGKSLEMSMPNRSADYQNFGSEIPLLDCRPGDVICFSGRSINRTIGHVGIVIDGHSENPLFIHASTSHGVRVDALRSSYFEPRFIGVRRVILP